MLVRLAEVGGADHDDGRKAAFSERLKAAMGRKGWGLSETARQASHLLGPDAKFGRAHVWHYLHRKAMPRARQLNALSRALEVDPHELLGFESSGQGEEMRPTPMGIVRAHDQGNGIVFLEVVQRVPWETALKILRLLHRPKSSDDPASDDDSLSDFDLERSEFQRPLPRPRS